MHTYSKFWSAGTSRATDIDQPAVELLITMLVSTNDVKLVQELFPRTIVMNDGRIMADAKAGEIHDGEKILNEHGLERP